MWIRRLNKNKLEEGRTINLGRIRIYLHRPPDQGSALVVGIEAPPDVAIEFLDGVPDKEPQNLLPIPPLA